MGARGRGAQLQTSLRRRAAVGARSGRFLFAPGPAPRIHPAWNAHCAIASQSGGAPGSERGLAARARRRRATHKPHRRSSLSPDLPLNLHPLNSGVSLAPDARRPGTQPNRGALIVVANSKTCLGCTKRGTRRRATRVSGFRARMATPTGRAVLKARRKKGRKNLVTKTLYKK